MRVLIALVPFLTLLAKYSWLKMVSILPIVIPLICVFNITVQSFFNSKKYVLTIYYHLQGTYSTVKSKKKIMSAKFRTRSLQFQHNLCPGSEFPPGSGHVLLYVHPLVLIQIQYTFFKYNIYICMYNSFIEICIIDDQSFFF